MTLSDATTDPILEVRSATVTFDMDRGQSRVLNNVGIDIHRKEILGVVGESGSGKSMFASALLDAIVKPGSLAGRITYYPEPDKQIDLLDLSDKEQKNLRWEEISMVFQGALDSFNPTMDIRGHFIETIEAHNYDREEGMAHARALLSDLYLDPNRVLDSYPHELSGGMKQRALIALSLVLEPQVLVMDEPTAALDLLMQRSIIELLDDLQRKYDLTVVFITHDLPLVADLADRLAVMYAFEFVEVGPTKEIVRNAVHPYTRALLKAVPSLQLPFSEMRPIEGSSPDPVAIPSGCSYHPRCPLADEQCEANDPAAHTVTDEHRAACFHWENSADAIPLSLENERVDEERQGAKGQQSAEPIISLKDVSVHFERHKGLLNLFNDPDVVQAVDDVDLNIYENDVIALVGESGCGKTTLGKTAVGGQRPTTGSVEYRGQDIHDAKEYRGDIHIPYEEIRQALQIIHQDPGAALNPNRKILKSLEVPLKCRGENLGQEERRGRILALLRTVGMTPPEDYVDRYPHQLSGGEKQRIALIRALLMNPDVILADEAVSALDVSLRVEMMDLMLKLQDRADTSYLFISHNLSNARYLTGSIGGRIGVMYLGRIVEIGPTEQIINNPRHPYTQVLKWSTIELHAEEDTEEVPIRGIDIPDPIDPPSGCRFHTRCPYAREVCTQETPTLDSGDGVACFREFGRDHPYWESDSLE